MKIILTAVNAKYIHSNLAVYTLQASAEKAGVFPEIREFTINQSKDSMLRSLFLARADVVCVSCYIWNISIVEDLITEYHKISPKTKIWLGGPEVSYHAEEMLEQYPFLAGIMKGEGEVTFREIAVYYQNQENGMEGKTLEEIHGITYRDADGAVKSNPWRPVMDLSEVDFPYANLKKFENRIIYYESSRGCPFSCSYCLSSIDKRLRFRNLDLVKKELAFFLEQKVPQVKFVDRTFNCKKDHAMAIWKFIAEHDNGVTNFHFEIAADLITEEELELLNTLRPGLVQLEIGVQSTNERTIKEIRRTMKFSEVARIVSEVRSGGNIHQHLDLIAGLPYEDMESFHRSFNDVYALRPQQLQLGFLKVLKGSYMEEKAVEYQLVFQERPPFEVLSTKWLSYEDVIRLKGIEEMVEVHYNSGQFVHTMERLEPVFGDAFSMYDALRAYYEAHGLDQVNHSRIGRYEILWAFLTEYLEKYLRESKKSSLESFGESLVGSADGWQEEFREALTYDLYLRENVKNRPAFAGEETVEKRIAAAFYEREESEHQYLKSGYEGRDRRQMRKMTHLERIGGKLLLFDYQNRDALCNQARVTAVEGL